MSAEENLENIDLIKVLEKCDPRNPEMPPVFVFRIIFKGGGVLQFLSSKNMVAHIANEIRETMLKNPVATLQPGNAIPTIPSYTVWTGEKEFKLITAFFWLTDVAGFTVEAFDESSIKNQQEFLKEQLDLLKKYSKEKKDSDKWRGGDCHE